MKVLELLKSKIGAISKAGLFAVSLTGGMVALNVYNYASDRPAALQPEVRSLSQIISSGGELPREYSGINLDARGVEFASAEERALQEGALLASFDGGEAQVQALEGIDPINVQGTVFSGGEAGLGFNQGAVEVGPNGSGAGAGGSGNNGGSGGDAVEAANKTIINKLGEAGVNNGGLKRASIATVNAGGASSFSPYGNAGVSPSGTPSATPVGPSSISGIPSLEGTTLVHAPASLRGATGSGFVAPNRNVNYRGGINSPMGRDLKNIAVQSSKVAAARHKQTNSHAQVFMASSQQGLGTHAVGDDVGAGDSGVGAAEDFEEDLKNKEGNLGAKIDEIDTTEQERKDHRTRLQKQMVSLLFTTFLGMMTIATMKSNKPWGLVVAIAVTALLAGLIGLFVADCAVYIDKYKEGSGWAIAGIAMAAVFATGVVFAWVSKAVTTWFNNIATGALSTNMGVSLLAGAVLGTLGPGMSITNAIEEGKMLFGDDDKSGLKNG
ncbi:MAG: hypothetical protein IKL48_06185 [Elusimicrobiaceae bacterium]|nr:hypothetical protein [Elusimicrobiaceae bacterium]